MAKRKELKPLSARQVSSDYLFMLIFPALMAGYYYRERALRLLLAGVCAAVFCELLAMLLLRRLRRPPDFNAIVIGASIALLLPASAPYYLAIIGSAFAVLAVKLPFGGTMHSPFVPAAAGFAFVCVSFPQEVFRYPEVQAVLQGMSGGDWAPGVSLASMLQDGSAPRVQLLVAMDIISGFISGPMGAGCILILLSSLIFPSLRDPRVALGPLGFLLTCAAVAFCFPRVQTSRAVSVLLELCAGMLVFAAVFFVTDPATSPASGGKRFLYGMFTGLLCMLFRRFGLYEEGVCFAVLAANAGWPVCESALRRLGAFLRAAAPSSRKGAVAHE